MAKSVLTAPPVITVDGPTASGKGTVSVRIASQLGWHFLDSGVLYRAVALLALDQSVDIHDVATLTRLASDLTIRFAASDDSNASQVFLSDNNVTQALRAEVCGNMASKIGAYTQVREALLARQRAFRVAPGLVADGRDMGTVVFPDARIKFYLMADAVVRAKRRYEQLKARGSTDTLGALEANIRERDARDEHRLSAPLRPAEDAIIVHTDAMNIDQVVDDMMKKIHNVFATLS